MKRFSLLLAIPLLAACGNPPERGTVIDHSFTPAWIQYIPGTTMCSGNPPSCTTMPPQIIPWPDSWKLKLKNTAKDGRDDEGWREVSQSEYEHCDIGAVYPECAQ
jgi:hypothetical protein